MAEMVTDNVLKIAVKKRKGRTGVVGSITRVLLGLAGAGIILFGVLLCVTIIGILPGIGVMGIGFGMVAAAFRRQRVECPACQKHVNVLQGAEDFECPRCKKAVILDWTE